MTRTGSSDRVTGDMRPQVEAAREQGRQLLTLAISATARRTRRQLAAQAFECAKLAAVLEEVNLAPPAPPVIWPRNRAHRRDGRKIE